MATSSNSEEGLYQTLQQALWELNFPETQALHQDLKHTELCICVLGSPLPYLSLLLEAGQRSPGDALLCLSPSWLSHSSTSLMVHKAVTFDIGGRTYVSSFNPPRRVTYFLSCDPYIEDEVTHEVDCPIGASGSLGRFWGDILTTRVLLQKAKIHTPKTLALLVPSGQMILKEGTTENIEMVHLEKRVKESLESVRIKVDTFLESEAVRHSDKVTLRCSGGRFMGESEESTPVYLNRRRREEVWARVAQLLPCLLPGEAVLLEAFCPPLKPGPRIEDRTWEKYTGCSPQIPDLSFRVCAIVTRSPQNFPLLYKLICRLGASHAPLSHHQALYQSLETTLQECGFTDPSLIVSLRHLATKTSLDCLRMVMETESSMSPENRGGCAAQTDMIGVDLLFTSDGSVMKPVVLGFHPSCCLHSSFPEKETKTERSDSEMEACRGTLLLAPFIRSQCYLMEGKTVLVVGAGAYSKKFIWEAAKHYKLRIILVDSDPNHFASKMVDHFFPLPELPDHLHDEQHCIRICDWLTSSGLRPDGCLCFWDDCVVLTSLVCERLGLRGAPPEAICIAKEKSRTHLQLLSMLNPNRTQRVSAEFPAGQADSQVTLKNGEREEMTTLADFDNGNLFNGNMYNHENACTLPPTTTTPNSLTSSSLLPSASFHPFVPLLSPSPCSYAVPCHHVESSRDLENAVQGRLGRPGGAVRFPAIMKLEYGAGAVGARKVGSLTESLAHFEHITRDLKNETDYPGIGLGWSNAMIIMEYAGGTEHDVDLLLFNGRLEGAFLSDNGPTRPPTFTETAAQMPSGLAADKRAQLITAAHHVCLGCGLLDGVFNVEMKMTERGPRLIEINARMGGFYLRDWILQLYGVDILMGAFMVACSLQPRLPSTTDLPAKGYFAGVMCLVSQHRQALRSTASLERLRSLHQNGTLWLSELAENDEQMTMEYEEPFCNIGVWDGCSRRNASQRLIALCQGLGLHHPPHYDLEYFLSHFT
ncbi:carnosine synthase 1-like [Lampris incognitus]|uniref:carnosine synthase 1-like n=1 Tax=Lampris incognitus TaxID=2546036 RepID=UPI0024B5E7F5|nr:carnosine synthase 1-like [Lampris incognitus]